MARFIDLLIGDRRDPRTVLAEAFDVPVPTSATPPREALTWVRTILDEAGVHEQDRMAAIAALRRERDLGLRPTKYLVDHLAHHRSAWPHHRGKR